MKYLHILALGGVALAVSVPLMTNYCIDGVNVSFYLRRLQKICPEDIFLLLPSLLVRAGAPVEFVYKLLLFGLNVATAGISYLCFYGIFRDRLTGVMGSMLYTWAPYRLNDLYCRADLGEAIALCFLPILFYGLYQICREETDSREYRRLWIVLALGYTLIVQAYLLSFLVAVGFTILYGILTWKRIFRRPALIVLLKTAAAFLVCNLWLFLILFLRLREGTFSMAAFRGEMIQSGGVFPSVFLQLFFLNGSSFRTAGVGTENMQPMGVGFAVTAGVLIFLWLVFVGRYRDRMEDREFCRFEKKYGDCRCHCRSDGYELFPMGLAAETKRCVFSVDRKFAVALQTDANGSFMLYCADMRGGLAGEEAGKGLRGHVACHDDRGAVPGVCSVSDGRYFKHGRAQKPLWCGIRGAGGRRASSAG